MTTVHAPTDNPGAAAPAPDPYAEIAAELRRVADDLGGLAGRGLPQPTYVALSIHPAGADDDEIMAAVDAVGGALLGRPGELEKMSGGTYHYVAHGTRGAAVVANWRCAVKVDVFDRVSSPEEREANRLRAELDELRAQVGRERAERAAEAATPAVVERPDQPLDDVPDACEGTEPENRAGPAAAPSPDVDADLVDLSAPIGALS